MISFDSEYMHNFFVERAKDLDKSFQRLVNKATFDNYLAAYTALASQCEFEYDALMNVSLWKDILDMFCDKTHSQFGMVAIIRAEMIIVNKRNSESISGATQLYNTQTGYLVLSSPREI